MCLDDGTFLIGLIPSSISLIITISIIIKSIHQLRNKQNIQSSIKILYYLSCIFSLICIISTLIRSLLCPHPCDYDRDYNTDIASYCALLLCILGTLLLRIHHSFSESVFKLTTLQTIIFIISYTTTILAASTWVFFEVIYNYNCEETSPQQLHQHKSMKFISRTTAAILYILCSIAAIITFVQKMFKLTNLTSTEPNSDRILSQQQMILLNTTSKYLSLLALAIVTSIITMILNTLIGGMMDVDIKAQLAGGGAAVDCANNIICLYLQFSFANGYYNRYCGCFGKFWNKLIIRRAIRSIKKRRKTLESTSATKDVEVVRKENESKNGRTNSLAIPPPTRLYNNVSTQSREETPETPAVRVLVGIEEGMEELDDGDDGGGKGDDGIQTPDSVDIVLKGSGGNDNDGVSSPKSTTLLEELWSEEEVP